MENEPQIPDNQSVRERLPSGLRGLFAEPVMVRMIALSDKAVSGAVQQNLQTFESRGVQGIYELYDGLTVAASAEEPGWGQDERDAATAIVAEHLPSTVALFPQLNRNRIVDRYVETVERLPRDSDYFGAPLSLYEFGSVLFAGLGTSTNAAETYQAQMKVRSAWNNYFPHMSDEGERAQARELIERMVVQVLPTPDEVHNDSSQWEWARSHPQMNENTSALHDAYLDEVRKLGSYKPYLAAHTPQFQDQLRAAGLDLAHYFNLCDPNQVVDSLRQLVGLSGYEAIIQRFDRSYSHRYAMSLTDLVNTPQATAIMADQISGHMSLVVQEIAGGLPDAGQLYDRLLSQALDALHARRPARKLGPVRNFLEAYGIQTTDKMPEEVVEIMGDPTTRNAIMLQIEERKAEMSAQLEVLHQLFPGSRYRHLQLMDRGEGDLYSADETRDCTAYHLTNGFNAWTLPHWLANPGFNMAYIYDKGVRLAKLGMQLAEDESGIRLVVDSIEVSKHAPEGLDTVNAITSGILELQLWAGQLGLREVIFCTYTNSSELTAEFPVMSPAKVPESLILFRNAAGLQEVWHGISESSEDVDPGYIQAEAGSDADDPYEADNSGSHDTLIDLERYLRLYTTPELIAAARQGDWQGVIDVYVEKAMPLTHQVFGPGAQFYQRNRKHMTIFSGVIEEQHEQIKLTDELLSGTVPRDEIANYIGIMGVGRFKGITVADIGPLLDARRYEQLKFEAARLEGLENIVVSLENDDIPIEEGLRRIFGAEEEESLESRIVKLRLNLPVINRKMLYPESQS